MMLIMISTCSSYFCNVLGLNAVRLVTAESRKVADLCKGPEKYRITTLCDEVDRLANQLADLQRRGLVSFRLFGYCMSYCSLLY